MHPVWKEGLLSVLRQKHRPGRNRKLVLAIAAALGLSAVPVYIIAKSVVQTSPWFWPKHRFTVDAWRTSAQWERYRFYKDLAARLPGMSKLDVESLLGKPDLRGYRVYRVHPQSQNTP
jgi:hypothetical protein